MFGLMTTTPSSAFGRIPFVLSPDCDAAISADERRQVAIETTQLIDAPELTVADATAPKRQRQDVPRPVRADRKNIYRC